MTDNFQLLIQKLDSFIRKYYKNQIIKGGIYSLTALLLFFLTIALLEYFAWLGTTGRTIIFYLYLIISALILIKLVFLPTFKLFRIGKIISHKQAASIIGNHFADVDDKLLNTLQLKELSDFLGNNSELINASIDQRIAGLKPVPFSNAIDFKGNSKYLKYAIPPVLVVLIFLLAAPSILTDPTTRIIKHSSHFEKAAPFQFVLENENLQAIQQDDFLVKLKIEGESVPESVVIYTGKTPFRMKKKDNVHYTYLFRNVQKNVDFNFEAAEFYSEKYKLRVLPKPIILNFVSELNYPSYTLKKKEILENTGDLVVPEGTIIKWVFKTRDTETINIRFNDSIFNLKNDISEENDLADSNPDKLKTMVKILNDYLVEVDALMPIDKATGKAIEYPGACLNL